MTIGRTWRDMEAIVDAVNAPSPLQLAVDVKDACQRSAWSLLPAYARQASIHALVRPDGAGELRGLREPLAEVLPRIAASGEPLELLAALDLLNAVHCVGGDIDAAPYGLPFVSVLTRASWNVAQRTRLACVRLTNNRLDALRVLTSAEVDVSVAEVERAPELIVRYLERMAKPENREPVAWDFYLNRVDGLVRRGYLEPETLLWLARVSMHRGAGSSTMASRFKERVDELLAGEALIERQQAWQVSNPHDDADDPMPSRTLGNGEYLLDEHLAGVGRWRVYLGHSVRRPNEGVLVSWVDGPEKIPLEQLRAELDHTVVGLLPLRFLGTFDATADPQEAVRDVGVLVESLPPGESARRRIQLPLSMKDAGQLAVSVGRIMERAAAAGILLSALRPEFIWVEEKDGGLVVTGVTARSHRFFESRSGGEFNSPVPFPRPYGAPEADRAPTERSLVFTLAAILAEWLSGRYPFPEEWHHLARRPSLCVREPADPDLDQVPPSIRSVLRQALEQDPEKRPTLASFVAELERVSE